MNKDEIFDIRNQSINRTNEKRYKIKRKIDFEKQIDEENKNLTVNSLILGATALSSIVCFSAVGFSNVDIMQKIGMLFLGIVSSKGGIDSLKLVIDGVARKAKLEDLQNIYNNVDSYSNEEKRGKKI